MKTTILIATLIFIVNVRTVFAGMDIESPGMAPSSSTELNLKSLAPVTPKEATFDEDIIAEISNTPAVILAPSTPGTASFDEIQPTETGPEEFPGKLAPITPKEVDFLDSVPQPDSRIILFPVTPKEAGFEDGRN